MLATVFAYDHLYLGGGNSRRVKFKLPRNVTIVSNDAGMEGGAFAWQRQERLSVLSRREPDCRALARFDPIGSKLMRFDFVDAHVCNGGLRTDLMMPPVSGNTALFLDIDGTLLDMARTPDAVMVPADLLRALERLARAIARRAGLCQRPLAGLASTGCSRRSDPPPSAPMAARCAAPTAGARRSAAACRCGARRSSPAWPQQYSRPAAGRQEMRAGAALPPGAGSARRSEGGDGKTCRPVRQPRRLHDPARQGGDRCAPARHRQGHRRARSWRGRSRFAGRAILFGGDDTTDLDVFRILPRLGGRGFSVGRHFPGAEHVFAIARAPCANG